MRPAAGGCPPRADGTLDELHPLVAAAADRGELPEWAECAPGRRRHVGRVAALLDEWAGDLGLGERDRRRWRAAGVLHDALRDAPEEELRSGEGLPDWPPPLLHAPACAARLRREGVHDRGLLLAVGHHPVGHPDFDRLGDHLYMADYLEPGRAFAEERRAALRGRMPGHREEVLIEVARDRLRHLLDRGAPILEESIRYWNRRVG